MTHIMAQPNLYQLNENYLITMLLVMKWKPYMFPSVKELILMR